MKRKIFSKLLMVALVIAAVGSFVSCKDYDDDINNLQKQIDAKAALSELTALQSTLDSKIAAAQSAAAAAQATADAAATKTALADLKSALETAIADAKKAGTDAGTQAGEAIAAANKAAQAAEDAAKAAKEADAAAKAELEAEIEKAKTAFTEALGKKADAAETADAIAAVRTIAEAAFTKAEAEKLQEQVNNLKSELEDAIDDKIDAKIQEVNNAVASVDAIWKAVTSIELVPSDFTTPGLTGVVKLLTGTEVANKFGSDAAPAGNVVRTYGAATEGEIQPVDYTAGKEIDFDNRIIIRVNPANAEVKKEDIVLINSKGESLEDYVEITKVEDYKQLITRANYATGLKVISIVRKDGVTDDQLAEATSGKKIKASDRPKTESGDAAYAIGIKNGESGRMLFTTFDLEVAYGDYTPLAGLNFLVKGDADGQVWQQIGNLKNRWNGAKLEGEDETKESPVAGKWYAEINGINITNNNKGVNRVYVDSLSTDGNGTNANYAFGDARTGGAYVVVDEDSRSFTVNLNDLATYANNWKVQYYYVVLDKYAAVESAPSEFQSWSKYTYTGLNTITPATDPLKVTIEDEAAIGDIIGFRVIAVNYDGSLVDLDGRSFYVQVGKPAAADKKNIAGTFTARVTGATPAGWNTKATALADAKKEVLSRTLNTGLTPITISDITSAKGALSSSNGTIALTAAEDGVAAGVVNVAYWLLSKNDGTEAANVEDIKFILLSAENVGFIVNGATITEEGLIEVRDADHHDAVVANLGISATKVMPTAPGFKWNASREPQDGVLALYPQPATAPGTTVAFGSVNSPSAIVGGDFSIAQYTNIGSLGAPVVPANFKFHAWYGNANKNNTAAKDVVAAGAANAAQHVGHNTTTTNAVGQAIFGNQYYAELYYEFAGISCTWDATTKTYPVSNGAYEATASDLSSVTFNDALDPSFQSYGWNTYSYKVGSNATAATINVARTSTDYFLVWPRVDLYKYTDASSYNATTKPDVTRPNADKVTTDIFMQMYSANSANWFDATTAKLFTQTTSKVNDITAWYYTEDGNPYFGGGGALAVKVIADGTEYYTGALAKTTGVLTLTAAAVVPPATTLDGVIEIYAIDAYGLNWSYTGNAWLTPADSEPIATLPITLYHNDTAAPADIL